MTWETFPGVTKVGGWGKVLHKGCFFFFTRVFYWEIYSLVLLYVWRCSSPKYFLIASAVVFGWERLKALIRFFSRRFRNVLFFYGFKILAFKFQFHDCWLCSDREDLRGDLFIEWTLNVSSEQGAVLDSGSREQWDGPQPWGTHSNEGCTSG